MLLFKPQFKPQLKPKQESIVETNIEPVQTIQTIQSSVFMTQTELNDNDNDIAGKITFTNVYKSIPSDRTIKPIDNWKNQYNTEWRWRFLKIKIRNDIVKDVIEISYIKKDSNDRMYFNRYGQWVKRNVDPIFDQFVTEEYYAYS